MGKMRNVGDPENTRSLVRCKSAALSTGRAGLRLDDGMATWKITNRVGRRAIKDVHMPLRMLNIPIHVRRWAPECCPAGESANRLWNCITQGLEREGYTAHKRLGAPTYSLAMESIRPTRSLGFPFLWSALVRDHHPLCTKAGVRRKRFEYFAKIHFPEYERPAIF